jgi:hypothetical protein
MCIEQPWHPIPTLQRHNTENSKQIFPEKELRSLNLYFQIRVSVSDLHIPTISLPILLQDECENWDCGLAILFWEYINGIFVALHLVV